MSEFNEVDNIIEEETPVLHLELEDGTEQDCAVDRFILCRRIR